MRPPPSLRSFARAVAPDRRTRSGRVDGTGPVRIVAAGELIGDSTTRAYAEAEAWLSR